MTLYTSLSGNLDVWRVLNNTIYGLRSGFSFEGAGGTAFGVKVSGVTTPGAQSAYGGLEITLLTADYQHIDVLAMPLVINVTHNYMRSLSLRLSDPRVLARNYLDLNFSAHNPIPPRGHVLVRLPTGFVLDGSQVRVEQLDGGAAMDGNLTAVVVDAGTAEVRLQRDGLSPSEPGGEHRLRLHGVVNPEFQRTVMAEGLGLSTHDEQGRYIDVFDIEELATVGGRAALPSDLRILPHDLGAADTTLLNNRAGETTDGSISATLRNPLPPGGAVVVVFPSGFALPAQPTATLVVTSADGATSVEFGPAELRVSGTSIVTSSSTADGSPQLTLQDRANITGSCTGSLRGNSTGACHRRLGHVPQSLAPAGSVITVHFFGLVIPCWQQTTAAFELSTTTPTGQVVDLLRPAAAADTKLTMESNKLTQPSVSLLDPTTGALTSATISFRVFNAVPAGGAVRISFPPGFSFYGPATDAAFAGSVTAFSTTLDQNSGDPLDAVLSGGLVAMADDTVVHIFRDSVGLPANDSCFATGATCSQCEISVTLSNVRVPLFEGQMGPFEIATLTKQGAIIEALEVDDPGRYVDVSYGWYAPNPPPPVGSPAATRGGGGAAAAGLAVASALLLHRLRRLTGSVAT